MCSTNQWPREIAVTAAVNSREAFAGVQRYLPRIRFSVVPPVVRIKVLSANFMNCFYNCVSQRLDTEQISGFPPTLRTLHEQSIYSHWCE